MNNMACTPALAEGAGCSQHINCMLADRSLRCLQEVCQCREDTRWKQFCRPGQARVDILLSRWNGTQCVSSPGHGVKERQNFAPDDRERLTEPKVVRDDLSLIVSNLMGPLGLILTILIIIGVCIIIHNHKYKKSM